jgi:dienelactone hydrolase
MRALPLLLALLLAACGGVGPRPDPFTFTGAGGQPMIAELHMPPGTERAPVVVLSHDNRGKRDAVVQAYVDALKGAGAAVIVLDHYGPRSIDPSQPAGQRAWFTSLDFALDAFGALDKAGENPRIDTRRAGLVGFGVGGGGGAVLAAHQWLLETRPASAARFLAVAAVQPECSYRVGNRDTGRRPIRIIVGNRDTVTGKPACDDLASYLRAASGNVTVSTYQNARHGFSDPPGAVVANPQGDNITRCVWQQGPDGLWRERASGVSGVSLFRIGANEASLAAFQRSWEGCRTAGTETQGDAALRGRAVGEVAGHMQQHVISVRSR